MAWEASSLSNSSWKNFSWEAKRASYRGRVAKMYLLALHCTLPLTDATVRGSGKYRAFLLRTSIGNSNSLSYEDSKKSIWPLREGYRVAFPNQSFKLALFSRNFLETTPPQVPVSQGLRLASALSNVTSRHPPPTSLWPTEACPHPYSELHVIPSPLP